ncbi:MAG: TldD/PmbA family protein [candidate division WOR-3 bacterium]
MEVDLLLLLDKLRKRNVKCEIFYQEKEKDTLIISKQEVENYQRSKEYGIGIRVIKDRKQGFAYTTNIDRIEEVVEKAIFFADIMPEDDNWDFSKDVVYKEIKEYKEDPSFGEKINVLKNLESEIYSKDSKIKTVRNIVWEKVYENNRIINTENVFVEYNQQYQYVYTEVGASDGINERSGFEFDIGRTWSDINFCNLRDKVVWKATSLLGAKPQKTQNIELILPSEISSEFLELLSELFSSENVQKGKSLLRGLLGERISSPILNIIDDPTDVNSLNPRSFDDEGIRTFKKYILKDGVLKDYAYNIYTAKKESRASTGNGIRSSFKALPKVGYFNLYIEPGSKDEKDIIRSVKNGVYVISLMGLHLADTISGDFSFGIEGLWIKDGEFSEPVAEMTIAGNLMDFIKKITEVGNKVEYKGAINSPMLKLEDIILAGK